MGVSVEELQKQLLEAQAKVEAYEAEQHRKNAEVKQLDLYPDEPHVCVLIKSSYSNLEATRQSKFYELMDQEGVVSIKCPLSGLSTTYRNLTEWPKVNVRVPSKNVNSFFIKFDVRPEYEKEK